MPTITSDERLGSVLEGKYRLDRVLGEGGMGVVFAGEHVRLKRPVAVKFLHAHVASNADARRRFLREAESAALLKHPNVVDVVDVGESEDGAAFMVLEFLKGDSLADRIEGGQRLTEEETLRLLVPVCQAVGYAHSHGIVHRDLKPDNIFLAHGPNQLVTPKVLDFGIAKLLDGGASATQTGSIMGTPLYMSPEQANGLKTLGPPADVWSLGVILFECLTGTLPWTFPPAPTLPVILVTIATRPASPILTIDATITPELAEVVDRCLVPDAAMRFADAEALANALEALRGRVRRVLERRGARAETEPGLLAAGAPGPGPASSLAPGTFGGGDRPSYAETLDAASMAVAASPARAAQPTAAPTSPGTAAGMGGAPVANVASVAPDRADGAPVRPEVSGPIRSMTRALWAIAAVAALGLAVFVATMLARSEPAPAPQVVVTAAPAQVAPTPAVQPAPSVQVPSPADAPTNAGVADAPPRARASDAPTRPRAASPAAPQPTPAPSTVEPPPSTRPRTTTDSTMRRCANGVCSDIGGL